MIKETLIIPKDISRYEVVICKGLPASGKSTWAKNQAIKSNVKRISRDDLRFMLDNSKYTKYNESFILNIRDYIIKQALNSEKSIVVDDTNFNNSCIERIKDIVYDFNQYRSDLCQYNIRIEFFNVDVMECIRRNAKRIGNARVPHITILNMYNKYIKSPEESELSIKDIPKELDRNLSVNIDQKDIPKGLNRNLSMNIDQNESLDHAIICDLDGTLSININRSPYSIKGCIQDKLNKPVANILKIYKERGYKIIIFSGRKSEQCSETIRWLSKHNIPYDFIRMRSIGDMRPDKVIKREFYEQSVKGQYFVEFILDDRDQVVDLWRKDLGLPCFQVYYGNF